MDKRELQMEQNKLSDTIKKIEDHSYYIWELLDRKSAAIKERTSDRSDGIVYRAGKADQETLAKAKNEPYFGRIDISSEIGNEIFYIGKQGVRDKNENIVVVDWRMPLASVYYNFTPGQSAQSYTVTDEKTNARNEFMVDVLGKREYTIKDKKLIKFIQQVSEANSKQNVTLTEDGEELTITDDFLREILKNSNTTGYLKEIIATIQKEQDKAIRQPIDRNVIIQGAAGSGKSSIALHRLSYLLFNNKHIKPEKVLILGPSQLFISSVKGLLPDLNLEGIQQSTFQEVVLKNMEPLLKKHNVDPSYQYYFENVLFSGERENELRLQIKFKGSEKLGLLIDIFIEEIKSNFENKLTGVTVSDFVLTVEDLKKIYDGYANLPFAKRVDRFFQHVENYFRDGIETKIREVNDQCKFIVGTYLQDGGLSKDERKQIELQMESVAKYKIGVLKKKLEDNIGKWKQSMEFTDNPLTIYQRLLSHSVLSGHEHELGSNILELFKRYKHKPKSLTYFDLPPLFYIYILLYGVPIQYNHIVVDEAQDFSFMHFAVLKKITKTMTLLGDRDQSIFMDYGQDTWDELIHFVLDSESDMLLTMNTSYRSTKEIIDVANRVLTNQFGILHQPIHAINRSGPDIQFEQVINGQELMENIVHTIEEWKKIYTRIAIIHKDEVKAAKLAEYLQNEFKKDVVYINPDQEVKEESISVLASYYSKGMEFDAVILVNINEENFPKEDLYARLLYVLLTRAQQTVKIFYQDTPSPLLDGVIQAAPKGKGKFEDIL